MAKFSYQPFKLGIVVATESIQDRVASDPVLAADISNRLNHHKAGQYGDISAADKMQNDEATNTKSQILSVYNCRGVVYWIQTDAGHGATTIMLPSDM
ncbi:hypothetical protein CMI47_07485 [Candidatus Pacearchaeota archaeon]|nr:hypothetical protein [Candidatus Pacearchaeota archaeon]|tara:strand:- start:2501 stop:2794 length:294 start_codon:yes stop_codon:yes gene_type:complete